jgi:hypothetical protein
VAPSSPLGFRASGDGSRDDEPVASLCREKDLTYARPAAIALHVGARFVAIGIVGSLPNGIEALSRA